MGRMAILALALTACVRVDTYRCDSADDCGAAGTCQPIGYCSFADPACRSGERYGEGAGGLSHTCVGGIDPVDASVDDAPLDDDAAASDGAMLDGAPLDGPAGPIVAHLAPADAQLGTVDWTLTGTVTLDTTTLSVTNQPIGAGGALVVASQVPMGGELAVLHLDELLIAQGATLKVVGARPLVIVCRTAVLDGRIDASADGAIAGPGGSEGQDGPGAGSDGQHAGNFDDGGGGGAGFGGPGAAGGTDTNGAAGGLGGNDYGDDVLTILEGGSGGGSFVGPSSCATPGRPGGGGGALQLFVAGTLTIRNSGGLDAGGGGGAGGRICSINGEPGRGGGAGGAIYVQASAVTISGRVAANGGAGGAPASLAGTGEAGADGQLAVTPALGGQLQGDRLGGNGGARSTGPTAGTSQSGGDGGGGGGAVGRIVIRAASIVGDGNVSPAPFLLSN